MPLNVEQTLEGLLLKDNGADTDKIIKKILSRFGDGSTREEMLY